MWLFSFPLWKKTFTSHVISESSTLEEATLTPANNIVCFSDVYGTLNKYGHAVKIWHFGYSDTSSFNISVKQAKVCDNWNFRLYEHKTKLKFSSLDATSKSWLQSLIKKKSGKIENALIHKLNDDCLSGKDLNEILFLV